MGIDLKELNKDAQKMSYWQAHKFWVMIAGALVIALFLVLVAMNLYNSSGTAQVDLSRPEYENVRDKVGRDIEVVSFSATGDIDEETFEEFRKMFGEKADKVREGKYFSADAMTDGSLSLPRIID